MYQVLVQSYFQLWESLFENLPSPHDYQGLAILEEIFEAVRLSRWVQLWLSRFGGDHQVQDALSTELHDSFRIGKICFCEFVIYEKQAEQSLEMDGAH
jgi:hypothetical protein